MKYADKLLKRIKTRIGNRELLAALMTIIVVVAIISAIYSPGKKDDIPPPQPSPQSGVNQWVADGILTRIDQEAIYIRQHEGESSTEKKIRLTANTVYSKIVKNWDGDILSNNEIQLSDLSVGDGLSVIVPTDENHADVITALSVRIIKISE